MDDQMKHKLLPQGRRLRRTRMHTFHTILIMALLGYLAFVFIAESFNPFKIPKNRTRRGRYRVGLLIGGLLAISSIAAWIYPAGNLASSVRTSLSASILMVGAVILCLGVMTLYRWLEFRRGMHNEQQMPKEAEQAALLTTDLNDNTDSSTKNDSESSQVAGAAFAVQGLSSKNNPESADVLPAAIDSVEHEEADQIELILKGGQTAEENNVEFIPNTEKSPDSSVTDITESNTNKKHGQAENDADDQFPIELNAANQSRFTETKDAEGKAADNPELSNSVIADDLFEKLNSSTAKQTDGTTLQAAGKDAADVIVLSTDYQPVDEEMEWPDISDEDNVENAADINHLQSSMKTMSVRTEKIQDSVHRVVALSSKESYFRTCLEVERADHANAQQKQVVLHKTELYRHRKDLESEVLMRTDLQTSADQRLLELKQAQARVRELEVTLEERQRVFTDQMESLEKTRSMARDAAQLARRAAVAQQKARTRALQERAARERLEVSAKKAVDIARNAINKLAEEERRHR